MTSWEQLSPFWGSGSTMDSQSKFEVQVRYNTGWRTIEEPSPELTIQTFLAARSRWRNLKVRLRQDGRTVKVRRVERGSGLFEIGGAS